MKLSKKCIAFAAIGMAIIAAPSSAIASSQSGNVTGITYLNGRVFFNLSGTRTPTPGCDCCGRWEILIADPAGKALFDIILSAYQQGKTVNVTGSNICLATGNDTEGVAQANIS